ncbi:MAG: HD domain-containing protein [Nitrososphaeraceae archaeon]
MANFFNFVMELKTIKRSGWINKVKVKNPESVADHTYAMSTMVMVFSDILGMKTERAVKMAILHDLGESIIGDYEPNVISMNEKKIKETEALDHILNHLPLESRKEYVDIWNEYRENKTEISQLVHWIDKFEMALQAKTYESQGYPSSILQQFFTYTMEGIDGNDVLLLLEHTKDAFFLNKRY